MVRAIKKHPSLLGVVIVVAAIPFLMKSSWISLLFSAQAQNSPPAGFASTMIRIGLGPDALAAASVSHGAVSGLVQDVLAEWNESPTALATADAAYSAAKAEKARLERLVGSGRGSEQDASAYQTAVASLASAETSRAAVLNALFSAGVADLGNSQVSTLTTIRANRAAGWEAPLEFQVVSRTEAEWVALRNALGNERISADYGESANGACQTLLATARANAAVAAASTNCNANQDAVEAAWASAVDS